MVDVEAIYRHSLEKSLLKDGDISMERKTAIERGEEFNGFRIKYYAFCVHIVHILMEFCYLTNICNVIHLTDFLQLTSLN